MDSSADAKDNWLGRTQIVPSLIVLNARSASLEGQTLTLNGVAPSSIIFADRPVRAAGHALTSHLLAEWATGGNSFAKIPQTPPYRFLAKTVQR